MKKTKKMFVVAAHISQLDDIIEIHYLTDLCFNATQHAHEIAEMVRHSKFRKF